MRLSRSLLVDLLRYGLVAVVALAADVGSLALLRAQGVGVLPATTLAFLVGTVVNFALSHGRVFTDPVIRNGALNFAAYALVGAVGLLVNDVVVGVLTHGLHAPLAVAKGVSVVVVFGWNFLARRQFLYRGRAARPADGFDPAG